MKKTFSVLLLLCMLLSLLPVSAYATGDGTQQEISGGLITIVPEEGALPDSDEILDTYAQMVMYPQYTMSLFSVGDNRLGDDRLVYIYDALETAIKKIAAGNQLSTLELKLDASSSPLAWSYDELGVTADSDDSQVTKSLFSALKLDDIHGYLMMDLPYDLYWYDKTSDGGMKAYMGYVRTEDGRAVVTTLYFNFAVSEEFREPGSVQKTNWGLENELDCYVVNAAKVNAANTAALRARSIVDAYSSYSDYDKLKAYKEEICKLTDYNRDAASSSNTQYGDPWQLIYVFDDDPNTKVVCEGYSKAFQYLCDLSSFENSDTACYTVTGVVSGNGKTEMHMWNIVSLGGKNYLVDVTNSDTGTMGDGGQLFLAGATGDISTGYTVDVGGSRVSYTYSDEQKQLMGELLVLSSEAYSDEPVEHQHQWSSDWSSDGTYHWHECIAGDCDAADNSQKDGYGEHNYGDDNTCDVCGYTKPVEHQHQWSDVWSNDGTYHWHECTAAGCDVADNSQKDGYGEHNYGDDNVCDVCGYTKPVEHQHQWSDVWSNDGTHHWHECTAGDCDVADNSQKDGYGEHNYGDDNVCDVCGYTKPVEHQHQWSDVWSSDGTYHWHECTAGDCDVADNSQKDGYGEHNYGDDNTCDTCGYVKPVEHQHQWSSAWSNDGTHHWHECTAAGCDVADNSQKDGYGEHNYGDDNVCDTCGYTKPVEHQHQWSDVWSSDGTYHWHECTAGDCDVADNSQKDGYGEHNYGDDNTCDTCGYTKPVEHEHSWPNEWQKDENNHWKKCLETSCGAVDIHPHEWDKGTVTKEASTTEKGVKTYTCTVCGYQKTEEIPMLEHKHAWSTDWTKNSTHHWHDCTAAGCTITEASGKDGYALHTWNNGTVVKAATTTAAGIMEYTCTVCGQTKTEQIPILPTPQHDHVWSNAWTSNSTHHWHECTASGCTVTNVADKYGYAPHSFGAWRTVTAATSTKDGLMERQCVCGYKETKVIPAIGNTTEHTHNWSNWTFTSPNYWERTCSICHARDIKITEVVAPKITSGANAVWRQGSSNGLTFISDAPASQFKSVTLNGFTLSSTYYTVAEGSTIVTLKKSCLDQLGVGTHTLAIVSDGGTAQTTFTVKAKTIINNQTPTYNSTNPWSTPKTGDSSNMGLWIGMIVVCVVGIGAVAVYVVKKNKRR